MSSAEPGAACETPAWRRVASRTAGICGAAVATQLPPVMLVGWPMALADIVSLGANQALVFTCVGLVVSLTLEAVARLGRWPRGGRRAMLALGIAAAVCLQLFWGAFNVFGGAGMHERMERAGIADDPQTVRLHLAWFTAILASVSVLYLLRRRETVEAEQRRVQLEARWQQARRRVRILRDTAGTARLEPQVLFDCMGLARREYLRDARRGEALLDRLIDFLRSSLSATCAGPHTLGWEVDQALRFATILSRVGGVPIVDAVPPALRRLEVCPGLLLPLVQQWLTACEASSAAEAATPPPLSIDASLEGPAQRVLRLRLNGPAVAPEALLAESRMRLTDLYGSRASVGAVLSRAGAPLLDICLELPLELSHAA